MRTEPTDGAGGAARAWRATSGFPSPAEDVAEASLDLHALLVRRPAATFFLRMRGDAMRVAGLFDGDLLVVDRSLRPVAGRLIVLALAGELIVRRCLRIAARDGDDVEEEDVMESALVIALPGGAGAARESVPLGDGADPARALVWGVVTYIIHQADALPTDRYAPDALSPPAPLDAPEVW